MARPQVTVKQGRLEGITCTTTNDIPYQAYLGIPYAKPPIGDLKFRDPQPADDWKGVRDASVEGNTCASIDIFFKKGFEGTEDCLFLNIFVPESATPNSELPVMFWIHAGGFTSGSGNKSIYGPDKLIERNVIVVTFNYRLGPLGFLCLHTAEVPGNAGLKDQILALKWVNDNIKHFGGSKDNVTIFGVSAGGGSTHYLLMSPSTKGLFAKAIMQSGTSLNEWTGQTESITIAFKLGELLGLKTDDKAELLQFLRNVPYDKLITASNDPSLVIGTKITFSPVIEKIYPDVTPVITESPKDLIISGRFNRVPTISGITSNEGVLFAMPLYGLDFKTLTLDKLVPSFQVYIPSILKERISPEASEIIVNKIKRFYFENQGNLLQNFFNLMSDYAFVKDNYFSVRSLAKFVPETYYYRFSYVGSSSTLRQVWKFLYEGAGHADELGYLFTFTENNIIFEPSESDMNVSKQMTTMWTNFAKCGNPTPDLTDDIKTIWKPVTNDEVNCLDINEESTLISTPYQERIKFWEDLEYL